MISILFNKDIGKVNFELFSILGQRVFSKELMGSKNELSLSDLPSGIYVYNFSSNGTILKSGKIIKVE